MSNLTTSEFSDMWTLWVVFDPIMNNTMLAIHAWCARATYHSTRIPLMTYNDVQHVCTLRALQLYKSKEPMFPAISSEKTNIECISTEPTTAALARATTIAVLS